MERGLLADRAMRELEPGVVRKLCSIRRTRPIIFAAGIVAGTAISALLVALVWWRVTPPPPMQPTTVVVTVERSAPPPPPAPPPLPEPPPAPPSKCPAIATPDDAIGAALTSDALPSADPALTVAAASQAPQLAVLADHEVFVSDDLGRHFHRVFADREVDEIAVARDGVVYVRAGTALGYRIPEGDAGWREAAVAECMKESCSDRIAALGDRVVWMHDDGIAVSANQGRTWHNVPQTDFAWAASPGRMLEWRGSLYEVQHMTDMCGIDDYDAWRLTGDKIEHAIFHEHFSPGDPVLEPNDDAAATWSWRVRCRTEQAGPHGACSNPIDRTLFTAARLTPAEGGRALAIYNGALVELCGNEAHQVYRRFPFDEIAAVDSAGRPLVVRGTTLLHWSPAHGWRRLFEHR